MTTIETISGKKTKSGATIVTRKFEKSNADFSGLRKAVKQKEEKMAKKKKKRNNLLSSLSKASKKKIKKVGLRKSKPTLKLDLELRRVTKERSVYFKVESIK